MERILGDGDGREAGDVGNEHRVLVEAFEAGDLALAEASIRVHVETGRRLALEALEGAGGVL
jgi:DNA-binding GntR family transcriptional regulator